MHIRNDLRYFRTQQYDTTTADGFDKLDSLLRDYFLKPVFSIDILQLHRITFEHSSGNILEKVARGESVHRVRSLSELKRRLHG